MKDSLAVYLKALAGDISQDLISTENCDRLCMLAQHFPSTIASVIGFESTLNNVDAVADFFWCTDANSVGQQLLSLHEQDSGDDYISPFIFEHDIWQRVSQFCQDWAEPQSPLHQAEDIWLEFDFAQTNNDLPLPSLFFSAETFHSAADYRFLAEKVLPNLINQPLPESTKSTFLQCLNDLPANIPPFQIGVLLPRETQIRIYAPFVSYQELLHYLHQINWQGNYELWQHLLSQFASLVNNFQLQIELREHLCPEIAIELYPQNLNCWRQILNYLTRIGFCLPEKQAALLNYNGVTSINSSKQVSLNRQLGYLKMSFQPQQAIAFKAYLLALSQIDN